jgi:putative oxidoreductase
LSSLFTTVPTLAPLERRAAIWLTRYSSVLLRISMGLVFFGFGVLKFFPGVSPAEGIAVETVERLTFGVLPEPLALFIVAALETTIGILLLTGWLPRAALALLAFQLVGILSPLLLLTGELFAGPGGAPTLEGQYVLKDVILAAATLVIARDVFAKRWRNHR